MNQYIEKINGFFLQYGGYVSLVLYVILAYVWFSYDPWKLISRHQFIAIPFVLVIGGVLLYTSDFTASRRKFFGLNSSDPTMKEWLMKVGGTLGIYALALASIFAIFWLFANFGRFLSWLVYGAYALSVIGALALFYKLAEPYFKKVQTPEGLQLLKNVIFYLPCLLIELFDNIAGTSKSVWLLLLFEVVAIALYILLPMLWKSKYVKMGTVLADEPQYLNNVSHVDPKAYGKIVEKAKDSLHYAFMADVWINPQPTSTSLAYNQDTNILSFGDRVKIEYNGKRPGELIVKAKDGKQEQVIFYAPIKLQAWNKIIVNYDHGTLDIFVNNELVKSIQNVPYLQVASIQGGAENGINGGIKNIRFFEKPLTANQMSLLDFA
jgi:hypothetical protein